MKQVLFRAVGKGLLGSSQLSEDDWHKNNTKMEKELSSASFLPKTESCHKAIKSWMTFNFLLLVSDKAKVIVLGPEHCKSDL